MKPEFDARMKRYEAVSEHFLPRRIPVIIRVDGRSFSRLTRALYGREWSDVFALLMSKVALHVMKDMQGCRFAYTQSDEISFLLTDYTTIKSEPWFGYSINKLVSISAGLATSWFCDLGLHEGMSSLEGETFDSRAFSVPHDDVCNYFIWRQQDATRNAIQKLAQSKFSHKHLQGKSRKDMQDMLWNEKGINFNDLPVSQKRGSCVVDGLSDYNIPIFTTNRDYIERWVNVCTD